MENRLREARAHVAMTQPEVSRELKQVEPRADVGMISRYEQGVCLPTREQLELLEKLYGLTRTELYRAEDLDLLGILPLPEDKPLAVERAPEPPSHAGKLRKCYRISKAFAASLPEDLLEVCGYSSWQSWHDAALKRLLGEYGARVQAIKRKERAAHEKPV